MTPDKILLDIQEQFYNNNGMRTDIYYTQGQGVQVVPEGLPLEQQNIILNLPEYVILNGGKVNINFGG